MNQEILKTIIPISKKYFKTEFDIISIDDIYHDIYLRFELIKYKTMSLGSFVLLSKAFWNKLDYIQKDYFRSNLSKFTGFGFPNDRYFHNILYAVFLDKNYNETMEMIENNRIVDEIIT